MNAIQRQTFELIKADYPEANVSYEFPDNAIEIESNDKVWFIDEYGVIVDGGPK